MYNLDKVLFKLNCFVTLFFTRWTAFKNCMLTACHHRESKQVTNTSAFLFFLLLLLLHFQSDNAGLLTSEHIIKIRVV